jgi:hypothetical protein
LGKYSAGDGINIDGSGVISLDSNLGGDGLSYATGVLSVNVDDSTIEIDTDALRVKALGISDGHIASDAAIAWSKLAAGNDYRILMTNDAGVVGELGTGSSTNKVLQSGGEDGAPSWVDYIDFSTIQVGALSPASAGPTWGTASSGLFTLKFPYASEADVTGGLVAKSDYDAWNAKANPALDNLASVQINTDLIPDTDATLNLGSDAKEWSYLWAQNIQTSAALNLTAGANSDLNLSPNQGSSGTGDIKMYGRVVVVDISGPYDVTETEAKYNLALSANISTPTVITALNFDTTDWEGCILEYKIKEATSNKVRIGRMIIAAYGTGSSCSASDQYSETDVLGNATGLSLDAINDSGTVKILYTNTHASNACTMRCEIKRIA